MRKTMLFALFAVLLMAVMPAFAQDNPGTIADIVVASAGAEKPEFATLLAAVSAADPAVLEALSNADADKMTVFAPTDAAFAKLAETLGAEAFQGVLADQAALTGILLFHVVPGEVKSADVVAGLENGPFSVRTLQGQNIDIAADDMGGITINGAKLNLDMVDIQASNGVIHVIEDVILPEDRTIADIVVESAAAEEPQFSLLLAAVQAADPAVLETLSNPEASLTVFAPTDAAFTALGEETLNAVLADQALLTSILLYHVVPTAEGGKPLNSADVKAALEGAMDGVMLPTALEGKDLSVKVDDMGNVVIGGNAKLVLTDVDAANGIIHVIDAVMLPQ